MSGVFGSDTSMNLGWDMVRSVLLPALEGARLSAVTDVLPVPGMDRDVGGAVVKDGDGVGEGVFAVVGGDHDRAPVLGPAAVLVLANLVFESENLSAAVRDAVGHAEVRQVGFDDTLVYGERIVSRNGLAGAPEGYHVVNVYLVFPGVQALLEAKLFGGFFFRSLPQGGAAGQECDGQYGQECEELFHIA